MKYDLLIRGGTVINPAADFSGPANVLIRDGKIGEASPGDHVEAVEEIDLSGCLVMPGLIDVHSHVFHGGTAIGFIPDSVLLPQGVTTTVDQGSSGVANVDSFVNTAIKNSQIRIFAYLHVSPSGLSSLPSCLEPVYQNILAVLVNFVDMRIDSSPPHHFSDPPRCRSRHGIYTFANV